MTEIGVTAMGFLIVEYLESVKGTKDDGKVAEAAQALSEAFGVSTGESKLLRRRKALVSRSFACLTPPTAPLRSLRGRCRCAQLRRLFPSVARR